MRVAAIVLAVPLALGGCAAPWIKFPGEAAPAGEQPVAIKPAAAPATKPEAQPTPTAAQTPTDIWQRLAADFSWHVPEHSAVRAELAKFARRTRGFNRTSAAAEPYLWHIAEQLRRRDLPAELALVPLIESRYRVAAESPYGAAGLWQFMPATGRAFGLRQTRWYDARLDVIASTRAALDYLERLHAQFDGDWLLAIAAYNCGPATVRRTLARHHATDFWAIADALPKETRSHVPRLLAAITVVADPVAHGIELHPIANAPHFEVVDLGGPLDLDYLLEASPGMRAGFKRLNPAYRRRTTGPQGPFRILAPAEFTPALAAALEHVPPERRLQARVHVVRRGETLSQIAARYDVPINALRRGNAINGNLIRPGQTLAVPAFAAAPAALADIAAITQQHEVATGESLSVIGKRYGLSSRQLARQNGLSIDSTLRPGQLLTVNLPGAARYDVAPGDSLWRIARRFKVTIAELRRWNGLARRHTLRPGQTLIVSRPQAADLRNI